jgi:glucose-6-phosphate isomerase
VTPESVGGLIALYERAVGFYASLVNINAYHQPGVEAGKKAAERALKLQSQAMAELDRRRGQEATAEEIAAAIGEPEKVESVYRILVHLAANRRGVTAKGIEAPATARFSAGQ